jgi:uncharacterized membrane protein
MRFLLVVSLLFSLAVCMAHAAANETDVPPAIPVSEGIVFGRAVFSNGTEAANSPIIVLARSNKSDTVLRTITDSSGRFVLSLDKGKYDIDSLLDIYSTPGIDFASTTSADFSHNDNVTLIFYPAGSLAGTVSQSGLPVSNARVSVSCPSNSFDLERINGVSQKTAGEAGDFLFRVLPVGTCIVSASTDSVAGSAEVEIAHGQTASAAIGLKSKSQVPDSILIVAALVVVAVALFFASQLLGQKKQVVHFESVKPVHEYPLAQSQQKTKANAGGKPSEQGKFDASTPRARAIFSTLTEREAEIVKFLFKCNGRAKRSQIQHKLLIPKTSLLRNLRSLERKNIVKLTPFGRNLLAEIEEKLFL